MASITGNDDILVVSGWNSAFIFDRKSGAFQSLDPPKSEDENAETKGPKKGQTSSEHADKHMASLALSNCGQYLALASSRGTKSLFLWHREGSTWKFVSQRATGRAASRIRFTNSASSILVADKAGDVYLFSVAEPLKEKEWLLGHITMLLDVLVSDDEKFVITCDRDDKIRVALYPNCYNIHSYCLGHTSFVTSLSFLPHNPAVLISTSGDGSVKFWNYLEGRELLSIPIDKHVQSSDDEVLPIKQCSSLKISTDSSLLSVCIGGSSICPIFKITGLDQLQMELVYKIDSEEGEIWWMQFTSDRNLFLLRNSPSRPVEVWRCSENLEMRLDENEKIFQDYSNLLQECFACPSIPSMLYRKKFDEPPEKAKKKS
ncbi:tRNA (guanine-N(7)-)-methyltransferase non-catalytic subunit wdr4 [Neocloeon triangulifer]|uniref:tRNA (guanine-N(7)-)-methyltransferase non-catalytic subunit wdr4 n=1 Tax=Neocloeon triangulifer TaxID=2078957 RepID=UPI00286F9016|nr:tRNA (guanine-N(7)-)-methyltransferase non-catalytic subunit wdr4 [Neocloeon triangulifer]XP_059481666.1 tRNA (guanine-N(7)-)-methyltransferase non-catalytic subunit wdr4 [Neocloeon triangulifer]